VRTTILDNPICSVRVAWRYRERIFIVKIVPNPFGGVNTHLWSNEAYIVGIVPLVHPAYSCDNWNGKGIGEKRHLLGSTALRQMKACYSKQKFENHATMGQRYSTYRGGATWHRQSGSGG
jgi:hypothetical protein